MEQSTTRNEGSVTEQEEVMKQFLTYPTMALTPEAIWMMATGRARVQSSGVVSRTGP